MSGPRVTQTDPMSLSVLIDGKTELYIRPASSTEDRWDLITVEELAGDLRCYEVHYGSARDVPPTPEGRIAIAKVMMPRGLAVIPNAYIHCLT